MEKKEYKDLESLMRDLHKVKQDENEPSKNPVKPSPLITKNEIKSRNFASNTTMWKPADLNTTDILKPDPDSEKRIISSEATQMIGTIKESTLKAYKVTEGVNKPPIPKPVDLKSKEQQIKKQKQKQREKRQQQSYEKRRTFIHILVGVFISVFIIAASTFLSIFVIRSALDFSGIATNEFNVEVDIPENATVKEIAQILTDKSVISMPDLFIFYSRLTKADNKYIAGTFTLSSTMSYNSIISELQTINKIPEKVNIRITEGMTANQIGQMLEDNFICRAEDFEKFYKDKVNEYSFEKRVDENVLKFYQLEGYLFPDTYELYVVDELKENKDLDTTKEAEIAALKMYNNFNEKITKEMYKKINAKGLTLNDAITLASMVQAEAATVEDMQKVASVFLNRLANKEEYPKLESDVTVLYVEKNIKPNIDYSSYDLYKNVFDAYNTYKVNGVPSGPICNPGMDAINAVIDVIETPYLYFCANEETLQMYFATTLAEHEANLVTAGLTGNNNPLDELE